MQRRWLWSLLFLSAIAHASVPLGKPRNPAGSKSGLFGCLQTNPYYAANFAAYPADINIAKGRQSLEPWCQNLPRAGLIHISIDLLDRDARHKPVMLRIVDSQRNVLAQTEPKIAPTGVVTTTVDLSSNGDYEAVLLVYDDELKVPPETSALHIPIHVGPAGSGSIANRLVLSLVVLMLGLALILVLALPKLIPARPNPIEE